MKAKEEARNQQIVANMVNKLRKERHPEWSRDKLLCHPEEAHQICVTIRQAGGFLEFAADWDDFKILHDCYLNLSKRSKLPSGIARRKHR